MKNSGELATELFQISFAFARGTSSIRVEHLWMLKDGFSSDIPGDDNTSKSLNFSA
jgi:hypothetical protein